MQFTLMIVAALLFAGGGLFMKASDGLASSLCLNRPIFD
jgi:hypothetical protein